MTTEAQKRAVARYRKRHVKQIVVRFWPKDKELYEAVKAKGGATYLKQLAEGDL